MVNKCAAPKCTSGYTSNKKKLARFYFPLKNPELNEKWVRFVNRKDWEPTKHTVLCKLHFEEKYLRRRQKCTLEWVMNPVPTIHSPDLLSTPSSLPTKQTSRNPPRKRTFQEDELSEFKKKDTITFNDLDSSTAPVGFQYNKFDICVLYFNLVYDDESRFPKILESIKIDNDLHVQLQYHGIYLPLPQWFVQARS